MTKEEMHRRLFIVYQRSPTYKLTDELVTFWWNCFRDTDGEVFWSAIKAAVMSTEHARPPTIGTVNKIIAQIQQAKTRDLAPHTPQEALMFILAIAKQHGLANRLQANLAAKRFPLVFQTIKLVGYETICSVARAGNYNPRRTVPTAEQESRTKAIIVKTYMMLQERFLQRRKLQDVLPDVAVSQRQPLNQAERSLLDQLTAPTVEVRRTS